MAKNFVTVSIFCLLCATHAPCSSHVSYSPTENRTDDGQLNVLHNADRLPLKKTVYDKTTEIFSRLEPDGNSTRQTNPINDRHLSLNNNQVKTKRDTTHKTKFDDLVYIEKIFALFGNGETMNSTGFERFVKSLGLERILWSQLNSSEFDFSSSGGKIAANKPNNDTLTCMDHRDLLQSVTEELPKEKKNSTNTTNNDFTINSYALNRLCPVLLYQLVAPSSAERQGCIRINNIDNDHTSDHTHLVTSTKYINTNTQLFVWLYSTISIVIISACGLLGVIVIPIMQQQYYHHLIQFLVALAVGTLSGDALLHLLPHAMMSHSHDHNTAHDHHGHAHVDDDHARNMWRGFVAMMGLIFFYFMEKCLTLIAEWRKQRQQKNNKVPAHVRVMRETDTVSTNSVGCKHKYSSYPYCYDTIATETQDDHSKMHTHNSNANITNKHNNTTTINLNEDDSDSEFIPKHELHLLETNQNMSKCTNSSQIIKCSESNKMLANNVVPYPSEVTGEVPEPYTVILRTHETKHHGHSHTHGHVHSAPKTMSSVAWMVIMGDGLHNFTDGMAIGAAFASSLAGGFSTAVAVFCHELPHEIGDFAVLLKAGMTARQAVFYNMLSSVLCLFGMIFGVVLGNSDTASGWLFACAAGMFLYIALVDMIPELTTSHSKEGGSLLQCALQFAGLLSGLGIMLLIALYENDLKSLFDD